MREYFSFSTVCTGHTAKIMEILSHTFLTKISWNQQFYKRSCWFHEIFFRWERISRFSTLWSGNCRNYLSHFFDKNFVKATVLLKSWIHEIFFLWDKISRFSTLYKWCKYIFFFRSKIFPTMSTFRRLTEMFCKIVPIHAKT